MQCPFCNQTHADYVKFCPVTGQPLPKLEKQRRGWIWVLFGIIVILGIFLYMTNFLSDYSTKILSGIFGFETATSTHTPTNTSIPTSTETPTVTSTFTPTITLTPTITPTPTLPPPGVAVERFNSIVVFIPAGEFSMGSSSENDEKPIHDVYLNAFFIHQTEVTNAMYVEFLNIQGNQQEGGAYWLDYLDPEVGIRQSGSSWQATSGYSSLPVMEVTWFGAQAYCEWAGGRLPTEAEWEKASRGEDERRYPWGNDNYAGNLANLSDSSSGLDNAYTTVNDQYPYISPVGVYPDGASPYGLLDSAGNVWEWVDDWYDENYYSSGENENPQGPGSGFYKVIRGGSWGTRPYAARTTNRGYSETIHSEDYIGFRCVFPVP